VKELVLQNHTGQTSLTKKSPFPSEVFSDFITVNCWLWGKILVCCGQEMISERVLKGWKEHRHSQKGHQQIKMTHQEWHIKWSYRFRDRQMVKSCWGPPIVQVNWAWRSDRGDMRGINISLSSKDKAMARWPAAREKRATVVCLRRSYKQ